MKAYLDNNVVCSIVTNDDLQESGALTCLLIAYDESKIELITSELTLDEITACPEPIRTTLKRMFLLLVKVPVVRWDVLTAIRSGGDKHTWFNAPSISNESEYEALLALGLDIMDARHVFVATKRSCNVFLTCDKNVLKRTNEIANLCDILVQTPSAFVERHRW
jgi:predicted nucleic acid-binding protein